MGLEFTSANSPRLGGSRLQGINNQSTSAVTPATILGSSLIAWFRADLGTWQNSGLTTPAANTGDPVGGWVDQSGNGNNLLQATSADRGTLELNDINGLPAIRFNGSSDYLATGSFTGLAHNTIVLVCRPASISGNPCIVDALTNANRIQISSGDYGLYNASGVTGPAATNNAWVIINALFAGGSANAIHINGGSDSTGTMAVNTITGLTAGCRYTVGSYFTGDIAEIILASGALSNTLRAQLDSYCDGRYAIY